MHIFPFIPSHQIKTQIYKENFTIPTLTEVKRKTSLAKEEQIRVNDDQLTKWKVCQQLDYFLPGPNKVANTKITLGLVRTQIFKSFLTE